MYLLNLGFFILSIQFFSEIIGIYGEHPCFDRLLGIPDLKSEVLYEDISLYDCIDLCLKSNFPCRSMSYNSDWKTCHLFKQKVNKFHENGLANTEYYVKREYCRPECHFKKYDEGYLHGFSHKIIKDVESPDHCLDLCLAEIDTCNSVQYNVASKKCYLSRYTKDINPYAFRESCFFTYWERVCGEEPKNYPCFETHNNHWIPRSNRKLILPTYESCLYECLISHEVCRSVQYDKTTHECFFNENDSETEELIFDISFVHFQRAIDCSTDCSIEISQGKVLKKSTIESERSLSNLDCIELCYATENCSSAQRNNDFGFCYLQKDTKQTKPEYFMDSLHYTYWEFNCP